MIASSVLVVCLVSLSALLGGAISSSTMTRSRDEATNLANNALEGDRNLPYDSVGLLYANGSQGDPPGQILTPQVSGKYTITTACTWVQAADGSTAYKRLKVTVSWPSPIAGQVEVNTIIYGKTALSGVGDLVVRVSNRDSPDPVAGSEITFVAANGSTRRVTTDSSGQALFGQVPVGPCTLSLVPPAGYIVDPTSLTASTVTTDSASTAIVYIQRPAQATVRVTDTGGTALSGTLVTMKRSDWSAGVTAYTDAGGAAVFSNVFYGDYAVTVSRDHYTSATLPFTASPSSPSPAVAFSLSPFYSHGVRAKVQDSNGTQIAGATVVLLTQAGGTLSQGVTGSNGEVVFTPIAVGTYSVTVSMAGYGGSTQSVTVHEDHDQETLTFSLTAQGSMKIYTTQGNKPVNCTLIVSCPSPYYYSNTLATGSGTNAVGELLLSNLLPGSYSVKKSGSSGSGATVVVTAGQTNSIILKN
jgi:hypothetical protein